jgi:peptide chain release factor 2
MSAPDFWNDSTKAQKIAAEANALRKKLDQMKELERKVADLPVHQELAEEDGSPTAQADYARESRCSSRLRFSSFFRNRMIVEMRF